MSQTIQPAQLCSNCKINPGDSYIFYYGKNMGASSTQVNYKTTRTATTWSIGGSQGVSLCWDCIQEYGDKQKKSEMQTGLTLTAISVILFLITKWLWSVAIHNNIALVKIVLILVSLSIFLWILGFALGSIKKIFSCLYYFLSTRTNRKNIIINQEMGEKYAIELKRPEVFSRGFDTTWTPKEYNRLPKSNISAVRPASTPSRATQSKEALGTAKWENILRSLPISTTSVTKLSHYNNPAELAYDLAIREKKESISIGNTYIEVRKDEGSYETMDHYIRIGENECAGYGDMYWNN